MKQNNHFKSLAICLVTLLLVSGSALADTNTYTDGCDVAMIKVDTQGAHRTYTLTTSSPLRDNLPEDKTRTFTERPALPLIRTGSDLFDGLYALTIDDAKLNSVSQIRDWSFDVRETMNRDYFQTGQKWTYVWTRDISYSVDLGLASLDPERCVNSLLFKTTSFKADVGGPYSNQIVQDTGSGGSYPVSTDRVVWAIAADTLLDYLDGDRRAEFLDKAWKVMQDTIEHDRQLIYDPADGLYRGEQSFLDWREQSYPMWTKENVLAIARSKALSTNIGHYCLLRTAAKIAEIKDIESMPYRYSNWANQLKDAINKEFYDADKGLYRSIILDDEAKIRLNRYDLLGESLAIIFGIADDLQAKNIIANYPQGKFGPSVVWPQDRDVPIYHNHAIWPFVTAYWLKASAITSNHDAINYAVDSLVRGTALNLSNMENLDMVTGRAYAKVNGIDGPVINSQRQLWSVAGYMSMVQDVVFGLDTNFNGIKFSPKITAQMRSKYFKDTDRLVLSNLKYRGKNIKVTVNLPDACESEGIYRIQKIQLNNKMIDESFVDADKLKSTNEWEIWLADCSAVNSGINLVDITDQREIFGPKQPKWIAKGIGGVTVEENKLQLHFDADGEQNILFNIYRNGILCASALKDTKWIDPDSNLNQTYFYNIESYYPDTGNCSHLSPTVTYYPESSYVELSAAKMQNSGGNLVNEDHFENWGKTNHQLSVKSFVVEKDGTYDIRTIYSNGAGPINTGITCSVKRIVISDKDNRKIVSTGYLVMPHTADWNRYLQSTPIKAKLKAGVNYKIDIYEDNIARNMSYFDHYEPYKSTGSGNESYNYVNISALRFVRTNNN